MRNRNLYLIIGLLAVVLVVLGVSWFMSNLNKDVAVETDTPNIGSTNNSVDATSMLEMTIQDCSNTQAQDDLQQLVDESTNIFGWLMFLSLNCEEEGQSTLLWETWKPTYAVYLPGGATPEPWGSPLPPRVLLDETQISGYQLNNTDQQPMLYEIRMNETTFDYILNRTLYSRAGQVEFFNADPSTPEGATIDFPWEAIEIKAAWIILEQGNPINDSYYTIESQYIDDDGMTHDVLVGLGGFHITSKILPDWVWITFENINNPQLVTDETVDPKIPTPQNVQELNITVHNLLPSDSVWKNYNLVNTQIVFVVDDGSPTLLANTLIETDFQLSSSCITCHALSARGSNSDGMLGFWNVTNDGIEGYTGNLSTESDVYYDPFDNTVCYDASMEVFTDCATTNPQTVYKMLDFVWSLRRAQ